METQIGDQARKFTKTLYIQLNLYFPLEVPFLLKIQTIMILQPQLLKFQRNIQLVKTMY